VEAPGTNAYRLAYRERVYKDTNVERLISDRGHTGPFPAEPPDSISSSSSAKCHERLRCGPAAGAIDLPKDRMPPRISRALARNPAPSFVERTRTCRSSEGSRVRVRYPIFSSPASSTPSASPFSKSPSTCAIRFVTWAKQRTAAPRARAKAYSAAASISTEGTNAPRSTGKPAAAIEPAAQSASAGNRDHRRCPCSGRHAGLANPPRGSPGHMVRRGRRARREPRVLL
jgi:hypothetical protein